MNSKLDYLCIARLKLVKRTKSFEVLMILKQCTKHNWEP